MAGEAPAAGPALAEAVASPEGALAPAPEGALPEGALERSLAPGPQLAEPLPAEQAAAGAPGEAPGVGPGPALAEVLPAEAAGPDVNTVDRFVEVPIEGPALGEILPPVAEGPAAGTPTSAAGPPQMLMGV